MVRRLFIILVLYLCLGVIEKIALGYFFTPEIVAEEDARTFAKEAVLHWNSKVSFVCDSFDGFAGYEYQLCADFSIEVIGCQSPSVLVDFVKPRSVLLPELVDRDMRIFAMSEFLFRFDRNFNSCEK